MKKNRKWLRITALVLAMACLVSAVFAAVDSMDLSKDGKVNVWDLQLAVNENASTDDQNQILTAILGNPDELNPVSENTYEIYTTLGLYNMAKLTNAGKESGITFELMNDIDMQGTAWQSTESFNGIFEGNGYVISNVNVYGEILLSTGNYGNGFFGKIGQDGAVRNLKLENVTNILTADSKANFIGLLTGSLTGEITNCTTVGTVIDPRTTLPATTYVGTLAGRIENVTSYTVPGISVTDESILMTAESAEITAISGKSQKVLCKMGTDFGTLSYPEGTASGEKYSRKQGIAGYPGSTLPGNFESYKWQDISGACTVEGGTGKVYNLEDPILTERRQAVVDKMYEICTVEWTPSQNMTIYYYKIGTGENDGKLAYSTKTWKAGTTYRGMPYNHGSGSLERFEYWMDGTDSQGRLVTKTSLPTTSYYYTHAANTKDEEGNTQLNGVRKALSEYTDTTFQTPLTFTDPDTGTTYDLLPGFTVSDQPLTVGETVQSADHAGFSRYVGNDCSQAIAWSWREVVSNEVKTGGTVISGVTQMTPLINYNDDGTVKTNYQTRYGVLPVGGLVPYSTGTSNWNAYCSTQGETAFFNAYAQASRGDGLIMFATAGGHSRMVAYDPICIRGYDATKEKDVIDATNSYIITHEQGRSSSGDGWSSTCYANCVYTFDVLYNYENYTSGIGSRGYYMPMTIPAFHDVNSKAVTSTVTYNDGVVKSNFYISSVVMDGQEVFPAVGQHSTANSTTRVGTGYRDAHLQENLNTIFGDITGKTVTVKLANGDVYTVDGTTGAVTKN